MMDFVPLGKIHRQLFWILILFLKFPVFAQENLTDRVFLDVTADTVVFQTDTLLTTLSLPHQFIIPRSEKIYQNDFRLIDGIHYRLDARRGIVIFTRTVPAGDSLTIIFQKYPLPLLDEYYHRELKKMTIPDSGKVAGKAVITIDRGRLWEDIDAYGSNLEKSGSIVRGIEIGTSRDLTLNSGLNLQLSGYVTPDVQVVAALTDESTPLQPEGNTQTLQEVDKVFVKIQSPYVGGTLGDFNLSYKNSSFGNVNRKLQGVSAYGQVKEYHQQVTYASLRGTFHSNQFLGQEGNQGPYQLLGRNSEREIIVLAGTERVYLNGELQVRGENNHYIIDYSLGQILFTNNRLITGEHRIEVDFEYTNNYQKYGKNFVGISTDRRKIGKGLSYDIRFFREWDDSENLLEDSTPLTPQEVEILKQAGDDPGRASISGVDSVGAGNGTYAKRDTVLAGINSTYFLYQGSGKGAFNIRFSSLGPGKGSYIRERLGIFRFVGPGLGEYLPIVLIPLPADKRLGNVSASYQVGNHLVLNGEWGGSLYDQNMYSDIEDDDNAGHAYAFNVNYLSDATRLMNRSVGLVHWTINWKQQELNFKPLDRQFQPEFNYKWNLDETALQADENSVESNLFYLPFSFLQIRADGGIIDRGNNISSRRGRGELTLSDSTRLKSQLYYEWVGSREYTNSSDWIRGGGSLGKLIGRLYPFVSYQQEDRQVNQADSVLTGFLFRAGEIGMEVMSWFASQWRLSSRVRDDYLYNPDAILQKQKLSRSFTHQIEGEMLNRKTLQGRFSFTYRTKDYESYFESLPAENLIRYQPDPQFQDTAWRDNKSHLGRIELQYNNKSRTIDSRWQYRISSELQSLQEKVFIFVGEGRGNYRYDEQLQEYVPDPQGDFLLVILPTARFESITMVEASWQIRYRPPALVKSAKGIANILRNLSFYSSLKVDERSRESDLWQLYLLNFDKFQNINTTLRGTYTIDQDVFFFERNPDFGITLRSRYRDNLANEYIDSGFNETRRNWDRSISWRQSLITRKLSQETEYAQNLVERQVAALASRNRDVFGQSLAYTLTYRPVYAWQIQTRIEVALQKDRAEINQLEVGYWEFRPQINYALAGRARAQTNLNLLQVRVLENPFNRPIPFEMAKGKREGFSYTWNVRFEYFISTNITTTINFSGRRDAGTARTIYLGQAEVRAFF